MKSRALVLLFLLSVASLAAKADTIQFTATITAQRGLFAVPIGSTFTGYATYNGQFDFNNRYLAPPPLTSYAFNYPSAPASLSGFKWEFIERGIIPNPPGLGLMYVNFSGPALSFNVDYSVFTIFTPTSETINSVGWSNQETGTVTYTYLSDAPVSSTPEPASFALVGSGILAFLTQKRYRSASL
jgi:hypothetical protein